MIFKKILYSKKRDMMKKHSYLFILISLSLLIQACTPEPKLQFNASKIDVRASPLFIEQWKDGMSKTQGVHNIKRSESEYAYRIVSEKNGQKDGFERSYDKETKKIRYEAFYKKGIRDGLFKRYNKEGQLYKAVLYENGKKREVREYNNKKMMIHSTPYFNDKKHGVEQIYSYITGALEKRITYDNGTKKKIEEYCKKKISHRVQMDGCRHGMEKVWHCGTGILERETPYNTCKRHGIEKVYDKQGNLIYTIPYFNGLREGTVKGYYPNGNLKYQVTYHADKVDELGYYYDMQGKKERIDYDTIIKFEDRLPVSVEYWRL